MVAKLKEEFSLDNREADLAKAKEHDDVIPVEVPIDHPLFHEDLDIEQDEVAVVRQNNERFVHYVVQQEDVSLVEELETVISSPKVHAVQHIIEEEDLGLVEEEASLPRANPVHYIIQERDVSDQLLEDEVFIDPLPANEDRPQPKQVHLIADYKAALKQIRQEASAPVEEVIEEQEHLSAPSPR